MRTRHLAPVSLATLAATLIWLILLIATVSAAGPLETLDQALSCAAQNGFLFYLTYTNAALVTLLATALFAGLYTLLREAFPIGSRVALVFLPVYAAMNLFVYLSQLAVVPRLLSLQSRPEYAPAARLLAAQMLQLWPDSLAAFANTLAYAALGIPSIIFGLALARIGGLMRAAGLLLALTGFSCLLGMLGLLVQSHWMQFGVVAGGALFLLALFPLTLALYRERGQ